MSNTLDGEQTKNNNNIHEKIIDSYWLRAVQLKGANKKIFMNIINWYSYEFSFNLE